VDCTAAPNADLQLQAADASCAVSGFPILHSCDGPRRVRMLGQDASSETPGGLRNCPRTMNISAVPDDGLSPIKWNSGAVSLCAVRDGGVSHRRQLRFRRNPPFYYLEADTVYFAYRKSFCLITGSSRNQNRGIRYANSTADSFCIPNLGRRHVCTHTAVLFAVCDSRGP
jgi:hypothetical protein